MEVWQLHCSISSVSKCLNITELLSQHCPTASLCMSNQGCVRVYVDNRYNVCRCVCRPLYAYGTNMVRILLIMKKLCLRMYIRQCCAALYERFHIST